MLLQHFLKLQNIYLLVNLLQSTHPLPTQQYLLLPLSTEEGLWDTNVLFFGKEPNDESKQLPNAISTTGTWKIFCLAGGLLHLFVPKLSPDKGCLILLSLPASCSPYLSAVTPDSALHPQCWAPQVTLRAICGPASVLWTAGILADPRHPSKDPLNRSRLPSVFFWLAGSGLPCLSQREEKSWQEATIVTLFLEGLSAVGICLRSGLQWELFVY